MRPGQNKRLRGRNNRKGPNPLTRSYESNGPDVKVRGTAQHIAEKYLQLARDAQSSGDPVMAESYLQHAEHYYRLIAAAQAAQQAQMGLRPAGGEAEIEDEEEEALPDRFASVAERLPQPQFPQGQPYQDRPERQDRPNYDRQPRFEGERQPRQDRQDRQDFERGDRPERQERQERQDRGERGYRQNFRDNRRFRDNRNEQPRFEGAEPRAADRPADRPAPDESGAPGAEEPVGLPAFITAPVRAVPAEGAAPETASRDEQAETGGYHLRPRRRRRRPAGEGDGAETGAPVAPEVE